MSVHQERQELNREDRVKLADQLRGRDTIAGLKLPDVRRAIKGHDRREKTTEPEQDRLGRSRAPRQYTIGAEVAEICVNLLLWEGREQDSERGIHKSFGEMAEETGCTEKEIKGARKLGEREGLFVATVGFRPGRERQRTLYWRLNLWRLHEVVFEGALEETMTLLGREGRKPERDALNKRRRALETALSDLRLDFLDEPENGQETGDAGQVGVGTSWSYPDTKLAPLQENMQEGTSVDNSLSTTVHNPLDRAVDQVMKEIYHHLKDHGYPLDKGEYSFNLERLDTLYRHYAPTGAELAELLEICLRYFEFAGRLDVANAVRRHRQQAARRELEAAEASRRGGRKKGRGKKHYEFD